MYDNNSNILVDMGSIWIMRSIGYLVYLLLHLLFDRITETFNIVSLGTRQSD